GNAGANPASNQNALQLALTNPAGVIDGTSALSGIYLNQTAGDFVLGDINAGTGPNGTMQLAASGSIYQSSLANRTVTAHNLDLRAGTDGTGAIGFDGTNFKPLALEVTGVITGYAPGPVSLQSLGSGLTVGQAGTYGTLSSGAWLTLNASGG